MNPSTMDKWISRPRPNPRARLRLFCIAHAGGGASAFRGWADALPPEVSTIIRLRFYEDLSLKEISLVTGCNLNTVKTRLYTGLKKLRVSLEGEEL